MLEYFNAYALDDEGNIIPGAEIEVRDENTGNLAAIVDIDEAVMINPFFALPNGFFQFGAAEGRYRIEVSSPSGTSTFRRIALNGRGRIDTLGIEVDTIRSDVDAFIAGSAVVPLGSVLPYSGAALPSTAFQWARGGSLVRANYTGLRDLYIADVGEVTVTIASPGVFTLVGHGHVTGSQVSLTTTGALPTGLAINTNYWVIRLTDDTFNLATSEANANAGTAINTSGAQSGTHTLVSNPFGIDGADNFFLPDFRGVSLKGFGDATINGRAKAGPGALGVRQEDQGQWITGEVGSFQYDANTTTQSGALDVGNNISSIRGNGSGNGIRNITFNSAGSPNARASSTTAGPTRDSSMGINFIVRVL